MRLWASIHRVLSLLQQWWRSLLHSQRREAQRIMTELLAVRGLVPLLMKPRNGTERWTPEEKAELLAGLRRVALLSPYLVFLLLPGSVFLLPLYAWWLDRRKHPR